MFALAQGLFWAGIAATFVMGLGTAIAVAAIATIPVGARGLARVAKPMRPVRASCCHARHGYAAAALVVVLAFGVWCSTGYMVSGSV